MEDSRLIENLLYTYAERIDNGDLEAVAEMFREGEIAAPAFDSVVKGYDEVLAMYQASTKLYPEGTPRTKHLTTNVIVEVADGADRATARAYFTVIQASDDFPLQPIIAGRYRDSFVKKSGKWQFERREMMTEQIGDLSQHLLFDAGDL